MWKLLNSRKVAVYLLCLFLGLLLISALIPGPFTVAPREWQHLQQENGPRYWIYSHFSTPFLVKNPLFAAISVVLFLSTLVCTIDRLKKWWSSRSYEFSKEKAFSFSTGETSSRSVQAVESEVESLLTGGRWARTVQRRPEGVVYSGEKGMSGFWGSIVFHVGLLVCFLAAPATVSTSFRGELALAEDDQVTFGSSVTTAGGEKSAIDPVFVKATGVRGQYYRGKFRYDFGGTLSFSDTGAQQEYPFAVNQPAWYRGFQFSLTSFGFSPHLLVSDGGSQTDNYLRVNSEQEANYFTLSPGLRAFVLFFPDFYREGSKIGTRSKNAVNPVTLVKLYRGEREVFTGLFRPGEEMAWEGGKVAVPDFKHWVTFVVTKEYGIVLILIGFVLVVLGLFARFLSNERRIELELCALPEGTGYKVSGYSRYYPAFLEKEVLEISARLKGHRSEGASPPC